MKTTKEKPIRINPFKLFYYRDFVRKMRLGELITKTDITTYKLRKLENGIGSRTPGRLEDFCKVERSILESLESALGCAGQLQAGQDDDFATMFVNYYHEQKTKQRTRKKSRTTVPIQPARAVVFDFDGTLTRPGATRTTWESLWAHLGYDENACGILANRFFSNEISHDKWCQVTLARFQDRGLTRDNVVEIGKQIELISGFEEAINQITALGIPMYIVSGSIWDVVCVALGRHTEHFERIEANMFGYYGDGTLGTIVGTRYDFEGKASFIRELAKELGIRKSEILFVGNSINDKKVKAAGARTLLVNPHFTDPSDKTAWDDCIPKMKSLTELLNHVDPDYESKVSNHHKEVSEDTVEVLAKIENINLREFTVVGGYRRYNRPQRARLIALKEQIVNSLTGGGNARENYLISASPGSGKTFFVEEIARSLTGTIQFVELDLSRDERTVFEQELDAVSKCALPCLCMIDEIDGRADEEWPYDVIYKKLDLNEDPNRPSTVFVLIGSSGGSIDGLKQAIGHRKKAQDMIDRHLNDSKYLVEIPSLGTEDAVCVYVSKVLDAARADNKTINQITKFAAYHALMTCKTPRQLKMLADHAVKRLETGISQLSFDHHFDRGNLENKAFWRGNSAAADRLADQHFDVSE